MGCAVWKAPSFVLVCIRYVATWNGQRATPRTAGLAAVASAVAGASACTRSAGPLMQLGPGSSPRESLPRRGLTAAWRHMAAARGSSRKSRTIPMFRLTRWASVRVTVPRLFQHLLLPHPLARPASGAPIDPSSRARQHTVPTGPTANARARCAIVIDTRSSPPRDLYCMELYRLCDGHTTRRGIG